MAVVEHHQLWSTPVWEIQTDVDDGFIWALLREFDQDHPDYDMSRGIWSIRQPVIWRLARLLEDMANEYAAPTIEPQHVFKVSRAWVNRQSQGESNSVHSHRTSTLVGVLYLECDDDPGDLILVDARGCGGSFIENRSEGERGNRQGFRVRPEKGKLVLFPGYVLHYTEANPSTKPRISVATNYALVKSEE